jgi:hypothetical protein
MPDETNYPIIAFFIEVRAGEAFTALHIVRITPGALLAMLANPRKAIDAIKNIIIN